MALHFVQAGSIGGLVAINHDSSSRQVIDPTDQILQLASQRGEFGIHRSAVLGGVGHVASLAASTGKTPSEWEGQGR